MNACFSPILAILLSLALPKSALAAKANKECEANLAVAYKKKLEHYSSGKFLHRGVLLEGRSLSTDELLAGFVQRSEGIDTSTSDPYLSTSVQYGKASEYARGIPTAPKTYRSGTRIVVTVRQPRFEAVPSDLDPDMKTRITAQDTYNGTIRIADRMTNTPNVFRVRTQLPTVKKNYFELEEGFYKLSLNKAYKPVFTKIKNRTSEAFRALEKVKAAEASLKPFYDAHSGVWEGYSVHLHTLMVLTRFFEQVTYYSLSKRIKALMRDILAVHDVNKVDPTDARLKLTPDEQHGRTMPFVKSTLHKLGYSAEEISLAEALIDNNVIGHIIKEEMSSTPEEGIEQLKKLAAKANLKLADYFKLQTLFYVCDAGSYPNLESKIFSEMTGMLVPKSPAFAKLKTLAMKEH